MLGQRETDAFGVLGQLVPTGTQDVALMENWSPHWDAGLTGSWSLLGYRDAEPMGDWPPTGIKGGRSQLALCVGSLLCPHVPLQLWQMLTMLGRQRGGESCARVLHAEFWSLQC